MSLMKVGKWWIHDDEKDSGVLQYLKHYRDFHYRWHNNMIDTVVDKFLFKKPTRTAVDIGACYGMTSVPLARIFDSVHSFEPNLKTFEALEKNTQHLDNVKLYSHALGNEAGDTRLRVGEAAGLSQVLRDDVKWRGFQKTHIDKLDNFASEISDIDLIKIDVEGFEFDVICGAIEILKEHTPLIICEMEEISATVNQVPKLLFGLGYVCCDIHRAKDYIFVHKNKL